MTCTRLTALCPGVPRWAGTGKVKPIWILLKQEAVSSSGISWAICKSAHRSRQITMPAPHHSFFYRPDDHPAAQPTVSKHWRYNVTMMTLQMHQWLPSLSTAQLAFYLFKAWKWYHQHWWAWTTSYCQSHARGHNRQVGHLPCRALV